MTHRLRILVMAASAAVVAYLFAPPDGSPAMTVSNPALMLVTALLYLPIVLVPAALLPIRILDQRLSFKVLGELMLRVVVPAFAIAAAEVFALSSIDGVGGVTFTLRLVLTFGAMVTILFVAQLLMVLQRNSARAA